MNIKEMVRLLRLSDVEQKHIQSYTEKAEQSKIRYCSEHDREYFDFEFEGMCPACYEEKLWSRYEHGDEQARQILEKSGRLEDLE